MEFKYSSVFMVFSLLIFTITSAQAFKDATPTPQPCSITTGPDDKCICYGDGGPNACREIADNGVLCTSEESGIVVFVIYNADTDECDYDWDS